VVVFYKKNRNKIPNFYILFVVPNQQSTPIASGKKMEMSADGNQVETGLQNLNSRFAEIIERNNQTMNENQKLKDELETVEDLKKSEINGIKNLYETELAEARRLLDKEAEKTVSFQNKNCDTFLRTGQNSVQILTNYIPSRIKGRQQLLEQDGRHFLVFF